MADTRAGNYSTVRTAAGTITRQLVRRHALLWPFCAVILLAAVGWWINRSVERAIKANLADQLETLLDADLAALQMWLDTRITAADAFAQDKILLAQVQAQLALAADPDTDAVKLLRSPHLAEMREYLGSFLPVLGYMGFVVVSTERQVVAAQFDDAVGKPAFAPWQQFLDKSLAGKATVSRPFRSAILIPDDEGNLRAGRPTMFTAGPLYNDDGKIIAAIGFRFRPDEDFTRILGVARSGESGETYAFDADGLLVSDSRFDNQLKKIGLLPDVPSARAIMNVQIRDPGVNMALGERPTQSRNDQPLTKMAASAIRGERGVDVDGYNDYRGVPVIGAWDWLDDFGFGVTTEVDVAEAFQPLYVLRRWVWLLMGLFAASALAALAMTIINERLRIKARHAAIEAKQLGQYQLKDKLGEGGMGVVYRAEHAMMQRPTAVKTLLPEKTTDATVARFEREVRLSSQLNHPNTIAIYDYGRTDEGLFYYAMEFLDGLGLDDLVKHYGPQSAARTIFLLRQVCGSLAEAHGIGLIHRDIKPANIMLNRRGGQYDVVKVLDFGLVKATDTKDEMELTVAGSITGTPVYLAPETFNDNQAFAPASDLYALGAVGYYLLTGGPPFQGATFAELCLQHMQAPPQPPSERLGQTVDGDLEAVILQCLAKSPTDRPPDANTLDENLASCGAAGGWTQQHARDWWRTKDDQVPDQTVLFTP